jgi:hypothetical protein
MSEFDVHRLTEKHEADADLPYFGAAAKCFASDAAAHRHRTSAAGPVIAMSERRR